MVNSREYSPLSQDGGSSPAQLTPNSKIKALLATLESDSEDKPDFQNAGSARDRLLAVMAKSATPKKYVEKMNAASSEAEAETDTESDQEEGMARGKGRLAAKMQANIYESEDSEPVADQAHHRVRKLPMTKSKSSKTASTPGESSGYDDNHSPVISRKKKIRTGRREIPKSSSVRRSASLGLFVSPSKPQSPRLHGASDSEDTDNEVGSNPRLLALVQKRRKERFARDAEAAAEKTKRAAEHKKQTALLEQETVPDDSNDEPGRCFTQHSRPPRKASKKALDDMNRETQRMSRNLQLTHKATTKKTITKESLFARFNFKPKFAPHESEHKAPTKSSSPVDSHSDVDMKDTPPTSPINHRSDLEKSLQVASFSSAPMKPEEQEILEDLSSLEEALSSQLPFSPPTMTNIEKGKAVAKHSPAISPQPKLAKSSLIKQRSIQVHPPKLDDRDRHAMCDSDSDLEIVKETKTAGNILDKIFDRVPAKQSQESTGLHALKMLAHLTSLSTKQTLSKIKPEMNSMELQLSLQQRARQQAVREREERLEALKAKGIGIQTTEERDREQAEFDDMLSKARAEAEQLGKREKAAAEKGQNDHSNRTLPDDSSDDEDWTEDKKDSPEELSLSGSEDSDEEEAEKSGADASEEEGEMEGENTNSVVPDKNTDAEIKAQILFDNEASESGDETKASLSHEEDGSADGDMDDENEITLPIIQHRRKPRNFKIISDEEESEDESLATVLPRTDSPQQSRTDSPAPNSVLRSATKTFIPGIPVTGPAGLGLTQIFAGTMDDSQMLPKITSQDPGTNQDSMVFLRGIPPPTFPPLRSAMVEETQDSDTTSLSQTSHIPESQTIEHPSRDLSQHILLHISESQAHEPESLAQETQMSPLPDPTQDVGFNHMTPIKGRFVDPPPSTVDTVFLEPTPVPEAMEETPIAKKKGKLRRRAPQIVSFSDEEEVTDVAALPFLKDEFDIEANVFDVMRKASKKKIIGNDFDKKTSAAKDMIHEQADESEDEFAGLGGASDEESGEEDTDVGEIIDDEGGNDVDERKLAAFFAHRERANDEKQVNKLYKDITKGMLRRKRGADYELSDSDDGGEARQRRKQREFAKMRKALLADERIGKIAENPKNHAFLRAIEDRNSDSEMNFLDDFAEPEDSLDSQSQSQTEIIPESQPRSTALHKRKNEDTHAEEWSAPHLCRSANIRKPSNLSEIRESLSSLIEDPNDLIAPAADSGSESEDELEIEGEESGSNHAVNKETHDPFSRRRTHIPIIDRISLKCASSSDASSTNIRPAYTSTACTPGFQVPRLLRRATTNSSITSTSTSTSSPSVSGISATERGAGDGGGGFVKRAGKNSGVNYFARENERRLAMVKTEKRRERKLVIGAQSRRKAVGGLLGVGKFS